MGPFFRMLFCFRKSPLAFIMEWHCERGVCAGLVFPNMDGALSLCYLCESLCLFEFVCFVKTPHYSVLEKLGIFPQAQTRRAKPNLTQSMKSPSVCVGVCEGASRLHQLYYAGSFFETIGNSQQKQKKNSLRLNANAKRLFQLTPPTALVNRK